MGHHLGVEEVEEFLHCLTPLAQVGEVVAHLASCRNCRTALRFRLPAASQKSSDLKASLDAAYDAAIDRAAIAARRYARQLNRQRGRSEEIRAFLDGREPQALSDIPRELRGLALYEALLERSWALRYEDTDRMVKLAGLAVAAVSAIPVEDHGARRIADYKCRAWAELANAYRVNDELSEARTAMDHATRFYVEGTEEESLTARLFDLQASLYCACRQFDLAQAALDVVYRIHVRFKNHHLAGRALISKGLYAGYDGEAEKAILFIRKGLPLIDRERDPNLGYVAVHNLARALMVAGQLREARAVLWPNLGTPENSGGSLNLLKLQWLEGEINVGLGELDRAEKGFLKVKEGFEEAGLGYHAAVVSLNVAAVWLRQGRRGEARSLVLEAVDVFVALEIQREALAAVLLLQKAFERRIATQELLDSVIAFLRQLEVDPSSRFEPPLP